VNGDLEVKENELIKKFNTDKEKPGDIHKFPVDRSLADPVWDKSGSDNWEEPWEKIRALYPELEANKGNLKLIMVEETGEAWIEVMDGKAGRR